MKSPSIARLMWKCPSRLTLTPLVAYFSSSWARAGSPRRRNAAHRYIDPVRHSVRARRPGLAENLIDMLRARGLSFAPVESHIDQLHASFSHVTT